MPFKIVFIDISKPSYYIPITLGFFLCAVFGLLLVIDNTSTNYGIQKWYYIIPAIIGISLIAIPQIKNIRQYNSIKHNKSGLTAKLLGHKTFGFEFNSVSSITLNEKSLEIKLKNQDEVITLSRKRYHEKSLLQLKDIIENKNS